MRYKIVRPKTNEVLCSGGVWKPMSKENNDVCLYESQNDAVDLSFSYAGSEVWPEKGER